MLPAWLALAWLVSKAQWFWRHNPDLQFGWIVLMLSAFVVWDQWPKRPTALFQLKWPAILFGVIGLGVLFVTQIYHAAYGMMPALLMGISFACYAIAAANAHYVFGRAGVRFFAFPFLFLLVAMPMPSVVYDPLVGGLQNQVATFNVEILNLMGIPAERVGSLIHLAKGTVGVDEACSGIRSLQSSVMATLFIGFITLKRTSLQVVLFGCGIFLAIIGNVARSLFLSFTANSKGVAAVSAVHDSAGWSILAFTAVGVGLVAWGLSKLEKWSDRETARLRSQGAASAAPAAETVASS
jgi:exosortase